MIDDLEYQLQWQELSDDAARLAGDLYTPRDKLGDGGEIYHQGVVGAVNLSNDAMRRIGFVLIKPGCRSNDRCRLMVGNHPWSIEGWVTPAFRDKYEC